MAVDLADDDGVKSPTTPVTSSVIKTVRRAPRHALARDASAATDDTHRYPKRCYTESESECERVSATCAGERSRGPTA